MKRTIGFLFRTIREEHQQTQELLALLHTNERFCLDDRNSQRPRKKQQMWLSTLGGKKRVSISVIFVCTQSQESSWLTGSQALSSLPLKVSRQNTPYN